MRVLGIEAHPAIETGIAIYDATKGLMANRIV